MPSTWEAVHGVGPHPSAFPRVKHADDIDPDAFDNSLSDDILKKLQPASALRSHTPA